jgi:2-isopropylmalate synthase
VLLELDGHLARGRGVSTDILEASGRAYLRALSNAIAASARSSSAEPDPVAATTP